MKILSLILLLLGIAACSKADIKYEYPEDPQNTRNFRAGRFFGDVVVYDGKKRSELVNEFLNQNKNILWVASFEVVSSLFPISVADSNSGIIVTDWYVDSKNENSRVKINILVKGKEINQENLVISIFKQEKDKKGVWQDKQSDNSLSIKLISDKILEKAHNLSSKK